MKEFVIKKVIYIYIKKILIHLVNVIVNVALNKYLNQIMNFKKFNIMIRDLKGF